MVMTTKSMKPITRSPDIAKTGPPTASACQQAVRLIIDSGKRAETAKSETAVMLAAFFDSELPTVWEYADGGRVDTADKGYRYFANAMNVTVSRISKYVEWGKRIELTRVKALPERVSKQLTEAVKQCPDKLPEILTRAHEISKKRYEDAGWEVGNAKVNSGDARAAQAEYVTVEPSLPMPTVDPHAALKKAVGTAMQLAQQVDDPGAEVYTALLNIWNRL